ncbi:MAG: thioredoxin family protein [Akkermansia sp.]|nr:thioredoxin family protein [Akkermansia sp.]
MKTLTKIGALIALAMTAPALPEAPNMETALTQAVEQKRDIFVDFTGTDWCTACIHLRNKVIESEAFEKAYGEKFVLVSVDFPRNPKLVAQIPDDEKRRRENLLTSYRIEGLPGVVLMDEQGLPYEIIHGARRTPEEYMPLVEAGLKKRAERDAAFAKAATLTGMEKAKMLAAGLMALPEPCRDKYIAEIDAINAEDPDNTLGFKGLGSDASSRIKQTEELRDLLSKFQNRLSHADINRSIEELDVFLARTDLHPEVRQEALSAKGDSYAFLRDLMSMYKCYKEALELAPESRAARRIRSNIEHFEQNILPMLNK